jgi:DHA1 family multidrug resistance protein-like MFS transporter
VKLEPAHII